MIMQALSIARTPTALLLALALAACSGTASTSAPRAGLDAEAVGITEDQRTVRRFAVEIAPAESEAAFSGLTDYTGPILAGVGCVVGAVLGEGIGGCAAGAALGFVGGEVLRMTVLEERGTYGDDEAFVQEVSVELEQEVERLAPVADAAERMVTLHRERIEVLNADHAAGRLSSADYDEAYRQMRIDEEALRIIVEDNQRLADRIDSALTGGTTSSSERLQELELDFLGQSGRLDLALQDLSRALTEVPREIGAGSS